MSDESNVHEHKFAHFLDIASINQSVRTDKNMLHITKKKTLLKRLNLEKH